MKIFERKNLFILVILLGLGGLVIFYRVVNNLVLLSNIPELAGKIKGVESIHTLILSPKPEILIKYSNQLELHGAGCVRKDSNTLKNCLSKDSKIKFSVFQSYNSKLCDLDISGIKYNDDCIDFYANAYTKSSSELSVFEDTKKLKKRIGYILQGSIYRDHPDNLKTVYRNQNRLYLIKESPDKDVLYSKFTITILQKDEWVINLLLVMDNSDQIVQFLKSIRFVSN